MRKLLYLACCFIILSSCTSLFRRDISYIPAQDEPVSIPFTSTNGLMLITAEINGREGVFLFDNGFSQCSVDPSFAKKTGIEIEKKTRLSDANSQKRSLPEGVADTLKIDDYTFLDAPVYIIETDNFLPCDSIDGVIGASVINLINWEINFPDSVMQMSSEPFNNDGFIMDISFSSNNSSFTRIVVKDLEADAKIDMGKTDEVQLALDDSEEHFKGTEVYKWDGIRSLSAHGPGNKTSMYKLAEPLTISNGNEDYPLKAKISLVGNIKYEAYFGIEYFCKYDMLTINSTEKHYILGRDISDPSYTDEEKSYGLHFYTISDTLKVIQLNPADKDIEGIELYDEVSVIDGIPAAGFPHICDFREYLRARIKAEDTLQVTIARNGKTYDLPYNQDSGIMW